MRARLLQSETARPPEPGEPDPREQLLRQLATRSARAGFRVAYDLLGERAEAEDAVQEALALACRSVERLRDPAAIDAWFRRVVTNVCLRALRRRRLRRVASQVIPGLQPHPIAALADAPAADELLARRGAAARLIVALEDLPPKQRAALVLRYGQDRSIAEVADMLGVGEGTVKTHLVRGLRRLRAIMEAP